MLMSSISAGRGLGLTVRYPASWSESLSEDDILVVPAQCPCGLPLQRCSCRQVLTVRCCSVRGARVDVLPHSCDATRHVQLLKRRNMREKRE